MDDVGLRTLVRARTMAETDELEKELLEVGGGFGSVLGKLTHVPEVGVRWRQTKGRH